MERARHTTVVAATSAWLPVVAVGVVLLNNPAASPVEMRGKCKGKGVEGHEVNIPKHA